MKTMPTTLSLNWTRLIVVASDFCIEVRDFLNTFWALELVGTTVSN